MDIFILPSRFEGLPMCALEAQVSGLFTIVSNNVTEETECSSYFGRLPLNLDAWIEMIEKIDLNYAREDLNQYLDIEKASSSNMAEQFRKYTAWRLKIYGRFNKCYYSGVQCGALFRALYEFNTPSNL